MFGIKISTVHSWTVKTPPPEYAHRLIDAIEEVPAFASWAKGSLPPYKTRGKGFLKGNKASSGRRKRTTESNDEPQLLTGSGSIASPSPSAADLKFSPRGWQDGDVMNDPFCDATLQKMGKTLLSIKFTIFADLLSGNSIELGHKGNKILQEACRRAYLRSDILPGSKSVTIGLDYSDFSDDF
jgi:hypothetical protein